MYDTSWVFVRYDAFGSPYVSTALVVGPGYRSCFASTVVYRDVYYVHGRPVYRGPDYDVVRRADHRVVHRPIREVDRDRPVMRPPQGTALPRPGTGRPKQGHDASRVARPAARSADDRDAPRDRAGEDRSTGDDRRGGGHDERGDDDHRSRAEDGRGHDEGRAGAASTGPGERQQPERDDIQGRRPELDARREAPRAEDLRGARPGEARPGDLRDDRRRTMDDRTPAPGRMPSRAAPSRRPGDDSAFRGAPPRGPSMDRQPARSGPSVQAPQQQAPQQQAAPAPSKKKADKKSAKKR